MGTSTIGCVAAATKILGDKWTPLLLRVFFDRNDVRFCTLEQQVPGINPRTLSARLVMLEQNDIIKKEGGPKRYTYRLTKKGQDFLPILKQMQTWGDKYYHEQISDGSQKIAVHWTYYEDSCCRR